MLADVELLSGDAPRRRAREGRAELKRGGGCRAAGLREPEASHLDLLAAFLPAERIRAAYERAVRLKYLRHDFGDLNLIL